MSDSDFVLKAWRDSVGEPALPDLAEVRAGADRLYRQVRRRNAIEYGACAFVILCFSAYALLLPSAVARIGSAMVVLGTLVVAWQLHRRASAEPPPERAAAEPILIHQRAQLARQHEALAGIFTWYLLPPIPGFVTMLIGPALVHGLAGLAHLRPATLFTMILAALVFTGVWWLNQRAAARLRAMIDEIDALTGDTG